MNLFAALLDRLAYEPRRNAKIRLIAEYFRAVPDPERGVALAAMTGALSFANAKPNLIRSLVMERVDPVLFALSYDYVGDLSETVALIWPARRGANHQPALGEIVEQLSTLPKSELPHYIEATLDALDETGRWAFLKLITGSLRIGVSARIAKTAVASLGDVTPDEVELVWPGLTPPYEDLFAWVEGRAGRPADSNPAPFRPVMLAHPLEAPDMAALSPSDFLAEWKWDGIRVQVSGGVAEDGKRVTRVYSRTGEEISRAFPDLVEGLEIDGAIDGELLIVRDDKVETFNVLQQRLNRATVSAKMLAEFPPRIRAYDILSEAGEDLRPLPFVDRRARLEALVARLGDTRIDLSPMVAFPDPEALAAARAEPGSHGAGADGAAVEGVMLKRASSPYVPGRPKGEWFKWKRDPFNVDAVMMYAQRGHGKRSSFYSDFTFGVWKAGEAGDELVPVGKAYFGFTDAELVELDRFVRKNTVNRFGPVREVVHEAGRGLVLEVAFEGLNRSTRHKSGVAMRFPRISRIRWDKTPGDADRIDVLESMLAASTTAADFDGAET